MPRNLSEMKSGGGDNSYAGRVQVNSSSEYVLMATQVY